MQLHKQSMQDLALQSKFNRGGLLASSLSYQRELLSLAREHLKNKRPVFASLILESWKKERKVFKLVLSYQNN
tara:strand:+ start:85015 stop:85233 length:219 start_codon:yes stop_codon:yes gene_type:complete